MALSDLRKIAETALMTLSDFSTMAQNWPKTAENKRKPASRPEIVEKWPKTAENRQKCTKMAENRQLVPKMPMNFRTFKAAGAPMTL